MYAVPNNCKSDLLNGEDMPGHIVMVERGEVSPTLGDFDARCYILFYTRCAFCYGIRAILLLVREP